MELRCPLCGRLVSLRYFEPATFSQRITGIHRVGLGRGRGFRTVEEVSLLDDPETMGKIKTRILELARLLHRHGHLAADEMARMFLTTQRSNRQLNTPTRENAVLTAMTARLTRQNQDFTARITRLQSELESVRGATDVIPELQRQLNQQAQTIRDLRTAVSDKDAIIEDLTEENIDLQDAYDLQGERLREMGVILDDVTEAAIT